MLEHVLLSLGGRPSSKTQGLGLGLRLEFGPGGGAQRGIWLWGLAKARRSQCTEGVWEVRRARWERLWRVRRCREGEALWPM